MQYLMLIYETADDFAARADAQAMASAWQSYHDDLVKAGVMVGGNALQGPSTGTTVRQREGRRHVQDGPYADTKEQLGGYVLFELPSLDAALDWAARCPAASTGAVEIRPVRQLQRAAA